MKTPLFWYQPPSFLSTLLSPLGWLYGKGVEFLRTRKKMYHFSIPILSVGNIVSGGAGKTPTALALAQLLQEKGINVHFVTRGFGGSEQGPLKVDPNSHSPLDVGDEPLLLAQLAPTWVAKERPLGVQKAIDEGAHCIILDDGHQTTSLAKNISFVVVDHLQGFGNGYVIPAGPLRENLTKGLKRSDALITIGAGDLPTQHLCFRAHSAPHPFPCPVNRVIAFCGIGFPQKFYKTLESLSVDLIATESFPDHYQYKEEDLQRLYKLATREKAALITTRKDWVKIPLSWRRLLYVLDITIQFEDPERLYHFILEKIPSLKEKS
ncbi:MAG: tetraacyldisaccharide 4'-kinase [Proteobacteria bacterium]|nr:tetraacyldisaccharide 4'-kinase [Pseudomonadota bacterium]